MNVAVVNVDSLIPNVALMKLSAWHKAQGDDVTLFEPLLSAVPDRLYASKVFGFTDDYAYFPDCEIVRGGTGYDMMTRLPAGADDVYPDYDLFGCDYAIGRLTRGCIRNCSFCVVWKMDGRRVHQVAELEDFWRGQERVRLLDDNLTALPELFVDTCNRLARERVLVKFDALDVRLMRPEMAASLAGVRRWGRVHFAFDDVRHERTIVRGIEALRAGGFPLRDATFYVLIGFGSTPEQDMHRVMLLDSLGCESFVMPFDKSDRYQRRFSRWANAKPIFRTCTFDEYNASIKKGAIADTSLQMTIEDGGEVLWS